MIKNEYYQNVSKIFLIPVYYIYIQPNFDIDGLKAIFVLLHYDMRNGYMLRFCNIIQCVIGIYGIFAI